MSTRLQWRCCPRYSRVTAGGGTSGHEPPATNNDRGDVQCAAAQFGAFGKAFVQLSLSAALLATTAPAAANNQVGAWSPVHAWPLITVHAVLMPDGRVLTYGSKASGQQTANFIYDVWDPAGGPRRRPHDAAEHHGHGHLLQLAGGRAAGRPGVHRRRRQLDRHRRRPTRATTTATCSTTTATRSTRQNNMNRPRWYSSSIALLNGEIYIQGGSGGTDFPEIRGVEWRVPPADRRRHRRLRLHVPAQFHRAGRPRVRLRQQRQDVLRRTRAGTGSIDGSGPVHRAHGHRRERRDVPAGQASCSSAAIRNDARLIDITRRRAGGHDHREPASTSAGWSTPRSWPTASVLATGGSDVWNEMTGVNYNAEIWNPTTGQWTVGPPEARRASTTRRPC